MSLDRIVKEILSAHPKISHAEILRMIFEKEQEAKGFLTRESAARLVAVELGVAIHHTSFETRVPIKNLVSGLSDVTVVGRVIFVSKKREFSHLNGKKGLLRNLLISDDTGQIKVTLWNSQTDLLELEEIIGHLVKISHGYVQQAYRGEITLNLGRKGLLKKDPPDIVETDFPKITTLFFKMNNITKEDKRINTIGVIDKIYPISVFQRKDNSKGKVRRLILKDDTGKNVVVLWNKKVDELSEIENGKLLKIFGTKVRHQANRSLELHVDSSTYAVISG